jgi:valyl-tRNA synthetase
VGVPDAVTALLVLFVRGRVQRVGTASEGLSDALSGVSVRAPRDVLEERYRKQHAHLLAEIDRGERKLGNEAFVAKAASGVVAKEREKLEAYRSELARVEAALRASKEPA